MVEPLRQLPDFDTLYQRYKAHLESEDEESEDEESENGSGSDGRAAASPKRAKATPVQPSPARGPPRSREAAEEELTRMFLASRRQAAEAVGGGSLPGPPVSSTFAGMGAPPPPLPMGPAAYSPQSVMKPTLSSPSGSVPLDRLHRMPDEWMRVAADWQNPHVYTYLAQARQRYYVDTHTGVRDREDAAFLTELLGLQETGRYVEAHRRMADRLEFLRLKSAVGLDKALTVWKRLTDASAYEDQRWAKARGSAERSHDVAEALREFVEPDVDSAKPKPPPRRPRKATPQKGSKGKGAKGAKKK